MNNIIISLLLADIASKIEAIDWIAVMTTISYTWDWVSDCWINYWGDNQPNTSHIFGKIWVENQDMAKELVEATFIVAGKEIKADPRIISKFVDNLVKEYIGTQWAIYNLWNFQSYLANYKQIKND